MLLTDDTIFQDVLANTENSVDRLVELGQETYLCPRYAKMHYMVDKSQRSPTIHKTLWVFDRQRFQIGTTCLYLEPIYAEQLVELVLSVNHEVKVCQKYLPDLISKQPTEGSACSLTCVPFLFIQSHKLSFAIAKLHRRMMVNTWSAGLLSAALFGATNIGKPDEASDSNSSVSVHENKIPD